MSNLAHTFWGQGDLDGARALEEQELAICRRVRGEEHPSTSTSAYNLLRTLRDLGETEGARALFERDLALLLDREPDTLGAHQLTIRERLMKMKF